MSTDLGARTHRGERPLLLLAILLALALRLIRLGADSLWYDETVSLFLAGQPAADLIGHTGRDIHPPGYYLLLRGWLLLTGYPSGRADLAGHGLEWAAAFFSLFFGVLLVPLAWRLACRLRLPRPAPLLAALLVAISPFGVWYSQEARMYTLAAALGLICLLIVAAFLDPAPAAAGLRRAALLYALVAAAGLYVLYYFAFLLFSLNLFLLSRLLRRRTALFAWLMAQAGALLLYLPWLPTAWRQASEPPVPPWRSAPRLLDALLESWGALSFGQSADLARFWPLLLLTLGLVAAGIARTWKSPPSPARPQLLFLLAAAFGPAALILLVSPAIPLYHVRYLFTYSPSFSLLLGLGLAALWEQRRPLGRGLAVAALFLLLLGAARSLDSFWNDPRFVADDLRRATRELAARWRPGDAILVNAGYAYPALLIYWPGEVAWRGRLNDFGPEQAALLAGAAGPVILQTGHVDGDPGLGWGDPRSDFYALPAGELRAGLAAVAAAASRLWQLRIYDTVNDPRGLIRQELAEHWRLFDDRSYSGEANLRIQGFWRGEVEPLAPPLAQFAGWLDLHFAPGSLPPSIEAGQPLLLRDLAWSRGAGETGRPVALSLRLVDDLDQIWAQIDEPIGGNALDLRAAAQIVQPMALAIPLGTPPGRYTVALVAYDPQTGEPFRLSGGEEAGRAALSLAALQVLRPAEPPEQLPALADFGLLRLVEASTPATVISPGDSIPVSLRWQGGAGLSGERLVVVLQLLDAGGAVAASLEAEPLAGRYPTDQWRPRELVLDRHELFAPAQIVPGRYDLIVGLYRGGDGERLAVRSPWPGLKVRDSFMIQPIVVRGE